MSRRLGRSRRWGSQRGSAAPPSLFQQVLALSAGRPVFTADKYVVDGVSGRVRGFVDWNDPTHTLEQATSANQVLVPGSSAAFNGAAVAAFPGTAVYGSTRPPSAWAFAHDGASCEYVIVFKQSVVAGVQAIAVTTPAPPGFQAYCDGASLGVDVLNGAGAGVVPVTLVAATGAQATYLDMRTEAAGSPQWEARVRGVVGASGAYGAAVSGTAPGAALQVGAVNAALAAPFFGDIAAVLFFPALTPAQRLIVETWIYETYGIVSPSLAPMLFERVLELSEGRPIFTADHYTLDGVSGRVRNFIDHSNPAHLIDQVVGANQVLVPAPHADFAGVACANFDAAASNNYVSNLLGNVNWMHDGTGGEYFLIGTHIAGADGGVPIGSRDIGGVGFSLVFSGAADIQQYVIGDGESFVVAAPASAAAAGVPGYVNFRLSTAATPDFEFRNKGTIAAQGDVTNPPSGAPSSQRLRLGGPPPYVASFRWVALVMTPALTPAQRTTVQQWIQSAYGIAA